MTLDTDHQSRPRAPFSASVLHHGRRKPLRVRDAPASGDNPSLTQAIALLVNDAFEPAEWYLWLPNTPRTDALKIAALADTASLLIAEVDGELAGCIGLEIGRTGPARLYMLAVSAPYRRLGIAEQLVAGAERRGRSGGHDAMRLEVMGPLAAPDERRRKLVEWYTAAGYTVHGTLPFAQEHPEIAPRLLVEADLLVMHKPLLPPAAARRSHPREEERDR